MKIKLKHFKIGMRIFKTGLSIFLLTCLYDQVIGSNPQIATLSAVFAQRKDFSETWHLGFQRILSNTLGGMIAILMIFLSSILPKWPVITYLLPMLGTMMTIKLCNLSQAKKAVVGGMAVFLIVYFSIPETNRYTYAIFRVLDTFVGASMATIVEWVLPRARVKRWLLRWKENKA